MWEPQLLTLLWVSSARYSDSLFLFSSKQRNTFFFTLRSLFIYVNDLSLFQIFSPDTWWWVCKMIELEWLPNSHTSLFWSLDSQAVSRVKARCSNIRDGRKFHSCISSCAPSKWMSISHSRLYSKEVEYEIVCSSASYIYKYNWKQTKILLIVI
jgi:hypothetical protein